MTTLERMARAYWLKRGGEWPAPTVMATNWTRDRMRELQAGRLPETDADRAALAVLLEEQAPRWDAPTSDPLTSDTMADALATLEEESARLDAGHVAALGINPRRAHLVSVAPPPPCATCGGTTWAGEPGQRVGCPDCRPEVTR